VEKLEVFQAGLGLVEPWRVTSAEFDPEQGQLDLYPDFTRGAQFPCPDGDADACPVHDTESKSWRHFDFVEHQAFVRARVPRVARPAHGVGERGHVFLRACGHAMRCVRTADLRIGGQVMAASSVPV
jgi:transposase